MCVWILNMMWIYVFLILNIVELEYTLYIM